EDGGEGSLGGLPAYLPIRDVCKRIYERANIFAAVSSIGAKKKSEGTGTIKLDLAFDLVCKKDTHTSVGCFMVQVTHKCMCIVRVVAAYPWQAKEGPLFPGYVRGHYRVRCTVEDPTARIHAYICGEDGVHFSFTRHKANIVS
ncbi:hypothetical protein B296_00028144, partial [Ensete ventricosum]